MSFLLYIVALIAAYSGLVVGVHIAGKTMSEKKGAQKYLPYMQKALMLIILIMFLQTFKLPTIATGLIILVFLASLWKAKNLNYFPILGVFFFLMGQDNQSQFYITYLVFIYGIIGGSLYYFSKKQPVRSAQRAVAQKYLSFIVVALILQIAYEAFILRTFF